MKMYMHCLSDFQGFQLTTPVQLMRLLLRIRCLKERNGRLEESCKGWPIELTGSVDLERLRTRVAFVEEEDLEAVSSSQHFRR